MGLNADIAVLLASIKKINTIFSCRSVKMSLICGKNAFCTKNATTKEDDFSMVIAFYGRLLHSKSGNPRL